MRYSVDAATIRAKLRQVHVTVRVYGTRILSGYLARARFHDLMLSLARQNLALVILGYDIHMTPYQMEFRIFTARFELSGETFSK
jgi:hypothetical protein